ncbi:pitrilysin family protein [Neolewinella lacunae]|uniref:Insulinase family protein n=1 Tax=Neolewinella lacunae TaxID=1517758 RepID=A0A923PIH6_9BACT|nr:pitrilysin family protein [Neolewinella lacunae]MBC6993215.1 insulinase family protein [Neolewinella lacunae]MDN3635738.1 pitrilysin family protein [Neolewinella lacunae]
MRSLLFVVCFLLAFTTLSAQDGSPKKITSVEGITEYQLDNGLQVLLFPDPSVPTTTVNITYKVGSRHEAYGETGMAHLLEHLVFKGTPKHPDIPAELTSHGARPNGTTWYDRTNYFETFAATDENLEWALDLEADRMVNSFIAKKDLDSEMTVVRNEFESGENDPGGVLMERVLSTAYLWHNYGKSTIGSKADLENVPIERLQGFYRKYYQPDNAVLLVAGKFDEAKTLELINQKFGVIPRPDRELYPTYTREPVQDGERFVELRRTGDVQVVQAAYHIPAGPHADYAPIAILMDILTDEPSGRLYKALVEEGDASVLWGFAPALAEPGFAFFNANVLQENDLAKVEAALKATIDSLKMNPPTEEEVKRAKDGRLKNFELAQRNANRVGLSMSEYIAQGDWRLGFIYRDRIEQVTPEDVMRVAQTYFKPSNRTIGRFFPTAAPDRAEIPEVSNLSLLTEGYTGRAAIAEGEEFDPGYDNIDGRTVSGTVGKTKVEYALLPKETRGNSVNATMNLRFGNLEKLKGRSDVGDLVGRMLMMGTEKYSRQEIQDKFDALKAQVFIGGGATGAYVSIETENQNLPAVIDLVGEILRTASFPETEFNSLVKEALAGVEESRSDPQAIVFTEMQKRTSDYPKGHPYYVNDFDEDVAALKSIKLEDLKAFYKDFYGASDATFAASGDMDKEAVVAALERNFGNWKSPEKYERIPRPYRAVKPDMVKLETPDKANAWFIATQVMPIDRNHPDYAALNMANFILGGGFLNSRLATRIRRTDGLSYGVGSQFNASDEDQRGTFMAYAIYNPENREALEKAFREEIERARTEGFTAEELKDAKSSWVQSQQMNRAQDRSLAGMLSSNAYLDRDMQWSKKLEEKMMSLTPEQINAAMTKYIDVDKMIILRAGDFARAEAKRP